jgi:hypothetical protein
MLAKAFEYATAWFLLSLIVGLLVGRGHFCVPGNPRAKR